MRKSASRTRKKPRGRLKSSPILRRLQLQRKRKRRTWQAVIFYLQRIR